MCSERDHPISCPQDTVPGTIPGDQPCRETFSFWLLETKLQQSPLTGPSRGCSDRCASSPQHAFSAARGFWGWCRISRGSPSPGMYHPSYHSPRRFWILTARESLPPGWKWPREAVDRLLQCQPLSIWSRGWGEPCGGSMKGPPGSRRCISR